jgi:hypothetical protein
MEFGAMIGKSNVIVLLEGAREGNPESNTMFGWEELYPQGQKKSPDRNPGRC